MFKRLSLMGLLVILLGLAVPAVAQGPIRPQHSDPTWHAQYWDNKNLTGSPVLTREEDNLNHDWGTGSPGSGVPVDQFSARWTRYIDVTPGTYQFSATSDDGIRVWIDDTLMVDRWYDHSVQTFTFTKYLGEGHHFIEVEYYENTVYAVAKLSWTLQGTPPPPPEGEWNAQYFNNMTLSGDPAVTRNEEAVNHDWGTSSPAPGTVNADHFSARWTRTVNVSPDMYHFSLTIDDGARLWVNGHKLIDAWYDQGATTYTGNIHLSGDVTIELEYYENTGFAVAKLSWSGGEAPPPPPPPGDTVIVDDSDAGFVQGGSPTGFRRVFSEGFDGDLTWTWNNDWARSGYNWVRWYPELAARNYEVFVYIPYRYTTTSNARYWVRHADGYTLRVVDQNARGSEWVSLGTYRFRGDGSGYVSLSDVTHEARLSRLIAFDAVKWEPR